jgi:hypothetical protein
MSGAASLSSSSENRVSVVVTLSMMLRP